MRRAAALLLLTFGASTLAQYPGAKPAPVSMKAGFDSIVEADARSILPFLAGPDFLGRAPDQPGYMAAAGYCASLLRSFGLLPAGENGSYLQRFTVQQVSVIPESAVFQSDSGVKLEWGKEFAFSAESEIQTRFHIAFVTLPPNVPFDKLDTTLLRSRVVIVRAGNAIAANQQLLRGQTILANPVTPDFTGRTFVSTPRTIVKGSPPQSFSQLRLSASAVTKLAQASGADNFLSETPTTASIDVSNIEFLLSCKVETRDLYTTANVVAKIEGTEPNLKGESVILGSHLDHMGVQGSNVFYGADDNASGCTANLLIARAFAVNPIKPKRTIYFCFWSMEERGLRGSQHFVQNPPLPLDKVVAYLNMDMLGRNVDHRPWNELAENNTNSVYAGIAKLNSPDLYEIVTDMNKYVNLLLRDDKEDRTFRSDTGSFVQAGIPSLKAFTGEHPDYHRPSDTADKINYEKLTNIAKWLYLCAFELANVTVRPRFEKDAKYLQGTVLYNESTKLSSDAVVEVLLVDVSKQDVPAEIIDRTVIAKPGQVPVRFTLRYQPAKLDARATYAIQARIYEGKRLVFASTNHIRVLNGGPSNNVEVVLAAVGP